MHPGARFYFIEPLSKSSMVAYYVCWPHDMFFSRRRFMRIFPVQQFLLLLTLGLAPISVHAIDYHSLFKEFKQTEWIRFDTMKWARNYISSRESMVIVVQYDAVREEVRFQTWKRCEKPDQTETLQWVARELFGTRSNCDNTVTRTECPPGS